MNGVSRLFGPARSVVAWSVLVSPTLAFGTEAPLVQQIGDLSSSEVAEAVAADVSVVPFSPAIDARTTPIIVAPGEMFLTRNGRQIRGLSRPERRALLRAYDAGQTIVLLHASVHDIEALHVLVKEGVAYHSSTDPTVLAYALRQENDIPTAEIVRNVRPNRLAPAEVEIVDPEDDDEEAQERALDVIISELVHPPVVGATPRTTATSTDWGDSPVQKSIIISTSDGIFNTPVEIYALHSCQEKMDYYLVNTGGTWTATRARFQSASRNAGQLFIGGAGLMLHLQSGDQYCTGGSAVGPFADERLCLYEDYPLWYEVDIVPPAGPTVVQVDSAPAGDQGVSASYSSGFSWNIGGGVEISGDGPSAGIQAGASWSNEVSTTVPPLLVLAGNLGPNGDTGPDQQGTFTRYQYCTVGSGPSDCQSTIQTTNPQGDICHNYIVGQPQNGQTPNGRLSNVAQTVNWRVDPTTYGNSMTFDITVTWQANMAFTQAYLWNGQFFDPNVDRSSPPTGQCNGFGCDCQISYDNDVDVASLTFNVPFPSGSKCPSG